MQTIKEHIKNTAQLSYPVIIGQAGIIMMGVVDNLLVGGLGAPALAAASIANGLFILIFILGIGICSAVTPLLPLTPFNAPARCNLTQLPSVCSTTPRLRAADASVWPDSTSRTASCLNSSVYLPRFPVLIFVSLSLLNQLAMGYVLRGQGHPPALPGWQ